MKEFNKELNKARRLKNQGKAKEALKIFEKLYENHPDEFTYQQKRDYAWTIYKVYVKNPECNEDLFMHAETITRLVRQRDLRSDDQPCVYTSAVFAVLGCLGSERDYRSMIDWFDKINPEFLNPFPYEKNGRTNKSKREFYLDMASNAYYKCGYYEECIGVSQIAFDTIDDIVDDSYIFLRVGRSLKWLDRFEEAIPYLKKAVKTRPYWYVYRDIAECYYMLKKPFEALKYVCPVIFDETPNSMKVEIYFLAYRILKIFNPDQAILHAKLYYLLKPKDFLPNEIRQLNFYESQLDRDEIESEIMATWEIYRQGQSKR